MSMMYDGVEAGTGAIYEWSGNKNAGAGRIAIVEATPSNKIAMVLQFARPFAARNMVKFTIAASGEATEVAWKRRGRRVSYPR